VSLARALAGVVQVTRFDDIVASLEPNVVAYWKLAESAGPVAIDEGALVNGTYSGAPTFGVPAIVKRDPSGQCARFSGNEHVDVPHDSALKTAEGTVLVFHQHDGLPEKATLLAADSNAGTGGIGLEVLADGGMRSFLAAPGPDYRILEGPAGDVTQRNAYCSALRWGSGGLAHDLFGEGGHIRKLTDPTTAGVTGTSAIRLGAWHTGVARHRGPIARVIWLDRRLSDTELASIALPRTLWEAQAAADSFTVAPGSGITPLDVQANDTLLVGDEITKIVVGSFAGNGSIAANPDGKRVDYTAPATAGSASFQYSLKRGSPTSNTVTVMVTVSDAGAFAGPTQLFSARSGDPLTSAGGTTIESQEPV
jgi:Bacterial Ig domain